MSEGSDAELLNQLRKFTRSFQSRDNPAPLDRVNVVGVIASGGGTSADVSQVNADDVAETNAGIHVVGHQYAYDAAEANWDRVRAGGDNVDNEANIAEGALLVKNRNYLFDDTNWDRQRSVSALPDGDDGLGVAAAGLMAFNGTAFDRLRVDAAKNLLVALGTGAASIGAVKIEDHDSATQADVAALASDGVATTENGVYAAAFLHAFDSSDWDRLRTTQAADGVTTGILGAGLYVYNGATMDRARSAGTGVLTSQPTDSAGTALFAPAAALADTVANPTVGKSAVLNYGFGGTDWDRLRSVGINADAIVAPSLGILRVAAHLTMFNGATFDRARGDITNGLDVDVTRVIPGTAATNLGKAEDAAHASGDVGVMALGVRQDTAAALAGTAGDYQPLITDGAGRLYVRVVRDRASDGAGRTHREFHGNVLTATTTLGTVNAGVTFYMTDFIITVRNSSTVTAGEWRINDGAAGTQRLGGSLGTAVAGAIPPGDTVQHQFLEYPSFAANNAIEYQEVTGDLTASITIHGFEV